MSKITSWLQGNRINPSSDVLRVLEDLGATEVSDLLDLQQEDILAFQPPVLKKLEFVRFQRGIHALHRNANIDMNYIIHGGGMDSNGSITDSEDVAIYSTGINIPQEVSVAYSSSPSPPTVISTAANLNSTMVTTSDDVNTNKTQYRYGYQCPPLPPQCPEKDCTGTLSCALGKRKNQNLINIPNTPDFRWMVSCSKCSTKWHACHFLCGHMARISTIGGSSDIIRHEMGRFNRWQKKIKPPCVNNPMNRVLKAGYDEERSVFIHKQDEERRRSSNIDADAVQAQEQEQVHSNEESHSGLSMASVSHQNQHEQNPGDNLVEQIVDCNKATGASDDLWFTGGGNGGGALAAAESVARIGNDELNVDDLLFDPNDAFFNPGEDELRMCPKAQLAAAAAPSQNNNNEVPKRVKLNSGGAALASEEVAVADPPNSKDLDYVCCEMEKLILAAYDVANSKDALHSNTTSCNNKS